MGKTATTISVVLGLVTVAFAGYLVFTNQVSDSGPVTDAQTMQNMLNNTKVFVQRRETLSAVKMNVALFEDTRFTTLHKFTIPIQEQPIGRPNPFEVAVSVSNNNR